MGELHNKRILVTGGAGFIGSNLVASLVSEGNEVIVLDNLSSGHRSNLDLFPSVKLIDKDIRDHDAVMEAVKDCEIIFHLAASVGNKRSIDDPFYDASINVLGTLNVLEAARKARVKKIVVSSSAGIFGELKHLPIKEDHPVEPDSPYGCTKLCEEKLSLAYSKLYSPDVICLRYFNVYGPNQRYDAYGNAIPIFVFRMLRGAPLYIYGTGEPTRDCVDVDDVVNANILAASTSSVSGVFNIASGKSITINRLVELIMEYGNAGNAIEYTDKRAGDVLHSLADIDFASRILGYVPTTSIEDGLRSYIDWARGEVSVSGGSN
jgi:UDP-glucose 4-epimerase